MLDSFETEGVPLLPVFPWPKAYVITGPSFVGKSTLGRKLKRMLTRVSSRRTCIAELPQIRATIGPVTYTPDEERIAYLLLLSLTRKALDLGINVVTICPGGVEVAERFPGEEVIAGATQIHVRCSLEGVLARQVRELPRGRRAYVGARRLQEIHEAYRYCRLPWVQDELEYDTEADQSRAFLGRLRRSLDGLPEPDRLVSTFHNSPHLLFT